MDLKSSHKRIGQTTGIALVFLFSTVGGSARAQAQSIADLTKALRAKESEVRAKAALELSKRGLEAKEAVPALIEALNDNEEVHRNAIGALGGIGPAAVPLLIQALALKDWRVRAGVVEVFQNMGQDAKPAVPALLKSLNDADPRVRALVVSTLGALEATECIPVLIEKLKGDQDADVRRAAAEALGMFGSAAKEATPALIQALRDPDDFRARLKRRQRPTMSGLLNSRGVKELAYWALTQIGAEAVPALLELLKDPDRQQQLVAVMLLGDMGSEAKAAVPFLVEILEGKDPDFRLEAAYSLGQIGPHAKSAVPSLTRVLKESSGRMRVIAAGALALIDPRNRDGLPTLLKELRDQKSEVRDDARVRLEHFAVRYGKEGGKPAVGALIEAVTDAKGNVAGAASHLSVKALVDALQDDVEEIRCLAADALGAKGSMAKGAIPALTTALMDPSPEVRKKAAEALVRIRNSE